MPPELPRHVLTEQLTPFVERAMKEADMVVVDHWARLRRRRIAPILPPCYFEFSEPGDGPDHPVSSHADPTPRSPIETLDTADSDVSRDVSDRQSQSHSAFCAFWALRYPFQDWGVEPNPTQVSGFGCLELREEKFIPRAESDDEE